MNKRLLELRETLSLNQEEFGKRIGVSKYSISNYEAGKRNITDRVVSDICREFGVNETWLRTGEGDMFLPIDDDMEFEEVWSQIRLSNSENADFIKKIMRTFWSLSEDKQAAIKELIEKMAEK